jgi:hypothetical protein
MAARDLDRDDAWTYMTTDSPSPYLFESKIEMLGRLSGARTPRQRFFARLFAMLVLLPVLIAIVAGAVGLLIG